MRLLYRRIQIMYYMSIVQGVKARQVEQGMESIPIYPDHPMPTGYIPGPVND